MREVLIFSVIWRSRSDKRSKMRFFIAISVILFINFQLFAQSESNYATYLNGAPLASLNASMTIGRGGPAVFADVNLIEYIAMFNRERLLPRVLHAKGFGAYGYFQTTHNLKSLTKAKLFSEDSKQTEVFVRFSSAKIKEGAADTFHDGRGMAIKFYTEEGNLDLLGINFPITPLNEPLKFMNMYRSKRQHSVLNDETTHWDFAASNPEVAHHLLMFYSEQGWPDGVRSTNTYPVHAFSFVNDLDEVNFAKFHFLADQPLKTMTPKRARELAATIPDYAALDLYKAIHEGNSPTWTLYVQIMTQAEAKSYKWNPFDPTKLWLNSQFPLREVGKLVLNRLPVNKISESEQSAFSPANLVPGIEPSPDPVLQARMLAYGDAQRHRLGKEYYQLPINKPIIPVHTYASDTVNRNPAGPAYYPNSFSGPEISSTGRQHGYLQKAEYVDRYDADELKADHFSQARLFYQNMTSSQKEFSVSRITETLIYATKEIQDRVINNVLSEVDPGFGSIVRKTLSITKPSNMFDEELRHIFLLMGY